MTWILAHVGRKYHTLTLSRLFSVSHQQEQLNEQARTKHLNIAQGEKNQQGSTRSHTLTHLLSPHPDSVGYKNEGEENREEKQRAAIMTNQQLTVWPCIDSISFFERITESRQDTAVVRYRKKDLKRPKKQRGKETYQHRR